MSEPVYRHKGYNIVGLKVCVALAMYDFGYTISTTTAGNLSVSTDAEISNSTTDSSTDTVNGTHIDDNTILDYFYGNQSETNEENQDNLDFSSMDIDTVKKLYENAHKRSINESGPNGNIARDRLGKPWEEANHDVPFFVSKAIDLMKQSVYATRYRLQDTRSVRKEHAGDPCYTLAIYYGSLMQLRLKLDNAFRTMMKLQDNFKFLWYLNLYERILAISVDVTYMVERMFYMKRALMETLP